MIGLAALSTIGIGLFPGAMNSLWVSMPKARQSVAMKSGEVTGRSAISAPAYLPPLVLPITCPVFSRPPAHSVRQALLKCPLPSPGVRPN